MSLLIKETVKYLWWWQLKAKNNEKKQLELKGRKKWKQKETIDKKTGINGENT